MNTAILDEKLKTDISLLFPDCKGNMRLYGWNGLSEETALQLDLYGLIDISTLEMGAYFTCDSNVIKYRQETFKDL